MRVWVLVMRTSNRWWVEITTRTAEGSPRKQGCLIPLFLPVEPITSNIPYLMHPFPCVTSPALKPRMWSPRSARLVHQIDDKCQTIESLCACLTLLLESSPRHNALLADRHCDVPPTTVGFCLTCTKRRYAQVTLDRSRYSYSGTIPTQREGLTMFQRDAVSSRTQDTETQSLHWDDGRWAATLDSPPNALSALSTSSRLPREGKRQR